MEKEMMVVILCENNKPIEVIGVYNSLEKAYDDIMKDADDIILMQKEINNLEYFRDVPNILNEPILIVAENPMLNAIENKPLSSFFSYHIINGNLNERFNNSYLDII
jgi:hypothetical protein